MTGKTHIKIQGKRILSELNDLKRTTEAAASELGFTEEFTLGVIEGTKTEREIMDFIWAMGERYPIDPYDLIIPKNDTQMGVKIMRRKESELSKRIFNRKNKDGEKTPYYEYRDTAMSRTAPFKPEWIKELRVVSDNNPENPDVAYNNGHFMHQMTFFLGPANFYYDIYGKKFCQEMNTGDSNYITPFFPHSFTSRSKDEEALIIAVTFGGEVRRAQKEIYSLKSPLENFKFDFRNHNKAISDLVLQHMESERLSFNNLSSILKENNSKINLLKILDQNSEKSIDELKELALYLNIGLRDLLIPGYREDEDIIIKRHSKEESFIYPNNKSPLYKINTLVRTERLSEMKGFDIEVLTNSLKEPSSKNLHSYFYNYGNSLAGFSWWDNGGVFHDELNSGDSLYLNPGIKHAFYNKEKDNAKIIELSIPGALNLQTQIELSAFSNIERVAYETKEWFN